MITKKRLFQDYSKLKEIAQEYFECSNYDLSLQAIQSCSKLAYKFNFIDSFGDGDLDKLLLQISCRTIPITDFSKEGNAKHIIFYDYFGLDNRGLTEQYLNALISLDYKVLLIISNETTIEKSGRILHLLSQSVGCEVSVISNKFSLIEKANTVVAAINQFKPGIAFIHNAPWDIVSFLVFSRYENIIKRFFINITDHAFWLGNNIFDTCIEFRKYGLALSAYKRNISFEKVAILNYYPMAEKSDKFLGFDFESKLKGKFVAISGGNGYKYIDKQFTFYHLVKKLMTANESLVLLLVGTGKFGKLIEDKAKKDGISERFIFLSDRSDIFPVLKRCDLYIGSFPFAGGLMTQFAAAAGLPLMLYNEEKLPFNRIEDLLPFADPNFKVLDNSHDFTEIGSKIIGDPNFRLKYSGYTKDSISNHHQFKVSLQKIISGDYKNSLRVEYNLSSISETMCKWHLDIENKYSKSYFNDLESLISFMEPQKRKRFRINHINKLIKGMIKKIKNNLMHYFYLQMKYMESLNEEAELENLKKKFKKVGDNFNLGKDYSVLNPQFMVFGDGFGAKERFRIQAITNYENQKFSPNIKIGGSVIFNTDVHIGCIDKVEIGDNCLFASRIYITDHDHGDTSINSLKLAPAKRQLISKGPVIIKDNVWVGEGVAILSGVTIGENSIIATNAVVTKSFPANVIIAGIPAKIIKVINV